MSWIADAVARLPHVPELPDRGPWAGMVGRASALLIDLPLELQTGRWRAASRPGHDVRKARALLDEDLDAVEELLAGHRGAAKLQVCGPLTLTSVVEVRGGAAVGDEAAMRDFAASLSEGILQHLADVRRRNPDVDWTIQVDEPALEAVVAGQIPTPSGYGTFPALSATYATSVLQTVVRAAAAEAPTVVHSCAGSPPMDVLTSVGAHSLSFDVSLVRLEIVADSLAEFVDSGGDIWAGVPFPAPTTEGSAEQPLRLLRRLRSVLAVDDEQFAERTVITPACGLAGQPLDVARAAYAAADRLATRIEQGDVGDSPEAEGVLRDGP
jgi:methionine synthase II (cobalamin-independent)